MPAARLVAFAVRMPRLVVAAALAMTLLAGWIAATHFAITADTDQLISPDLPFRRHEQVFDRAFPDTVDLTAIVVDGATPEIAENAATKLARALATDARFRNVRRPDGGPFFDRYGLLLLPPAEVQVTADRLVKAQPFLALLAADPSLHGIVDGLGVSLDGVARGEARLADLPLAAFDTALRRALDGKPARFSWRALLDGTPDPRTLRRFVTLQARLDYADIQPGTASSAAIRGIAATLGLDAAHGVRVRLTGPVPLADEEFASLGEGAGVIAGAMLLAVTGLLWAATRSAKTILAILATTFAGLIVTAALGLATVGRFNLISVAFIPLFVGLGIDFGIQFCVRVRSEAGAVDARLRAAGRALGVSLTLAATATAAGFFAFLPTDYAGVAELGVIAGAGMLVALLLTLTLLPALLALLRPGVGALADTVAFERLHGWDVRYRRRILQASSIAALLGLAALPWLRFDFNPLHLRDPRAESMSTLNDLLRDPNNSPNTIEVLLPDAAAATAMAARLERLPEVAQVVTLSSFVPADQTATRAVLDDTAQLLETVLTPFEARGTPGDAETIASLRGVAAKLRVLAPSSPREAERGEGRGGASSSGTRTLLQGTPPRPSPLSVREDAHREGRGKNSAATHLAATLEDLAAATPDARDRAARALVPGLNALLSQLRIALQPGALTAADLPADLVRSWQAPDGRTRVEVFPRGNDNAALERFADAVQAVAPNANGTPISIRESGRTIVRAFVTAGVLSLGAIAVLLGAVLRRARDVALMLLPILLAGTLTMATCVVAGFALNFANIIALPLMFGIGVAFHIYLIMAWRRGEAALQSASLARGVLFSGLTTGIAFGALALSHHPGTASMGVLLMISLGWTLVAALVFKPALLAAVDATSVVPPSGSPAV